MARKAWLVWADGRPDSPIEQTNAGVIELPLIGPEIAEIRLEHAGAPVQQYGPSRTRTAETWPLGRHHEAGFPPVRPVLLPVPDISAPPEPAKAKRKTKGAA